MSNSTAADTLPTSRPSGKTTRNEIARKALKCNMCKYSTSDRRRMLMHITRAHTTNKPFACSQCSYRTANHQSFQRHKQSHSGEEYLQCEDCDFVTTQPLVLDQHLRLHTKDKPYACDTCSYMTTNLNELMLHTQKHNRDRMFKCDICDHNVETLATLTEKRKGVRLCRIHSCGCFMQLSVHLCVHCEKNCIERWSYRGATVHLSLPTRIHYNYVKGVLACDICTRTFKAKIGYISHMRSHMRKRKLAAVAETQKILTRQMSQILNLHDITI